MLRKSDSRGFIGFLTLVISVAILGWLWWTKAPGNMNWQSAQSTIEAEIGAVQKAKKLQVTTDAHNAEIQSALEGK